MKKNIFILLLILSFTVSNAQNNTSKSKKIGLVLSGGGAKGFAHIGVLKVIDSLGIKIDYVAGTSMGAVIGSLYASGYSGKQLDSIFKNINFDNLITDYIPREAKTTYERENSEKYAITLPFDHFKLKLPSALSRGQNTFDLLTKLMLPHCNQTDFSKLPIPFFCIATNIENGAQVMLDSGNLPQAVRASSSLPSLFQPVLINNKLLIDGGVVNNYPIDELRAKGMNIIIGVDVQDELSNRTRLSSAPEILFQINNFRTINDMKIKSKQTDVYIKPDITKYNIVSFNDGTQIIKEGKKAALKKQNQLLKLKQDKPIKFFNNLPDSLSIKNISISGKENYTTSYIRSKLQLEQNSKISFSKFNKGTNNLIATNNFDSFFYEFKKNQDGYNLFINTVETEKTALLRLAVHYDGLYDTALLVNLTKKKLLFKNDIATLDLMFGDNIRYNFNYFIDKGIYWSVGVNSRYNEFEQGVKAENLLSSNQLATTNVNRLSIKYSDLSNQVFAQTQFRKNLPFRLGLEHKKLEVNTKTIVSNNSQVKTTFENSNIYSAFGQITYDTFDNLFFPNKGLLFEAKANYYMFSSDYNNNFSPFSIYSGSLSYAVSPTNKLSFKFGTSAGMSVNRESNESLNFVLGGYGNNFVNNFKSFYGYNYLTLGADSFIKGSIDLDYEILKKSHIVFSANYANVENDLFETTNWLSVPTYTGYALGYGYDSFLGPIEIKYTYSPDHREHYWFFNVGYWF